jgi:hypothetical protein
MVAIGIHFAENSGDQLVLYVPLSHRGVENRQDPRSIPPYLNWSLSTIIFSGGA